MRGARSLYFRGSGSREPDKSKCIRIYRGWAGVGWEAPGKGLVFAVNLRWEVTWPILGYERRSHWLELREGGEDSHRG